MGLVTMQIFRKGAGMLARSGLVLGLWVCTAQAGAPAAGEGPAVNLQGQRKFLNASIDFCIARVPALKAELDNARAQAEPQIRKAESLIAGLVAPTLARDRPWLDMYMAMWSKSADELIEALKKQRPESACPTLRDNWLALEADVIVEDWQNFLDRNLQAE